MPGCRRRNNPVIVLPSTTPSTHHNSNTNTNNYFNSNNYNNYNTTLGVVTKPHYAPISALPTHAAYHSSTAVTYYPRGCCAKRHRRERRRHNQLQLLHTINPNQQPQIHPQQSHPRHKGPVTAMASFILAGIGLGAQKIVEKKKERKSQKAMEEFEREEREASLRHETTLRQGSSSRKSGEAAEERVRRSESVPRYSESTQRQGQGDEHVPEVPPPSYEAVTQANGNGNGGRKSMLDV